MVPMVCDLCGLHCLRGLHPMLSPWSPCHPHRPHVIPVSSLLSPHHPCCPHIIPIAPMWSPWSVVSVVSTPCCPRGPCGPHVIPIVPTSSQCHPHHPHNPQKVPMVCGLRCLCGLHPMLSLWSPCHPRHHHVIPVLSPSSPHCLEGPHIIPNPPDTHSTHPHLPGGWGPRISKNAIRFELIKIF